MLRNVKIVFVSMSLFSICWPAAALAEAGPVFETGELRFTVGDAGRWLLMISGPDGYYQRKLFAGEEPRVGLSRDGTERPADGSYVWELRSLAVGEGRHGAVASGHFRVQDGLIRFADESVVERPGATRPSNRVSSVIGDPIPPVPDVTGDYYIDGRLAIGTAIDGTEAFGFASLLINEDNMAIKFDDSSTAMSGFPDTDWQIKTNDSSVSGEEYLHIEDVTAGTVPFRIDSGAASHSIRIDQNGNVGIGTVTPGTLLQVAGDATIEGDLSVLSSREAKQDFAGIDAHDVLTRLAELPVLEWSYLGSTDRHLGPVAEDFHAAFALGRDAHSISPLDLAGVALAAIQGLQTRVAELAACEAASRERLVLQRREIVALEEDREALRQRIEALENLVAELGARAEHASARP